MSELVLPVVSVCRTDTTPRLWLQGTHHTEGLSAVVWWFCSSLLISRLATPSLPPICHPLLDIAHSTFRPTSRQVRYLEVHKEAAAAAKEEKGESSAKSGKRWYSVSLALSAMVQSEYVSFTMHMQGSLLPLLLYA